MRKNVQKQSRQLNLIHRKIVALLAWLLKKKEIKPTTRFFSGKMLVFTKVLLESFVYDLTETFFFQIHKQKRVSTIT